MAKLFYHALPALLTLASVAAWPGEPLLVISNPIHKTKLSKEQLKEIYLGHRKSMDEWRVVPLDQKDSSAIRDEFYQVVAEKDPTEMKVFRAEEIFSGNARSLHEFPDDQAVILEVLRDPSAIGYVNASTDTSKVNVLLRIE